ncbi:MAG: glycosyltransferase family 9 protein, partial [Chthoniobacterales bacterium]|nr:glycosyltransferase family 9 protein [Chthoniobacterales bacterium]
MHILLLQLKRIGDLILTTSAINCLRQNLPQAKIHLAVENSSAPLLPCIDHDHAFVFRRTSINPIPWLKFTFSAYRQPYSFCFDFTCNDRSALATALSHAKTRVIYSRWKRRAPLRSKIYNAFIDADIFSLHTADYFTALLAPAGIHSANVPTFLTIPPFASKKAQELLSKKDIKVPFCIVHPCSVKEEKFWFPDRWAAIIAKILQRGFSVILTGTASQRDRQHTSEILQNFPLTSSKYRIYSLTGETDLSTLAAIIARCSFLCGVDSAPIHMADALNRPSLALFGPINPIQWRPRHPLSLSVTPLGTGPFHPKN